MSKIWTAVEVLLLTAVIVSGIVCLQVRAAVSDMEKPEISTIIYDAIQPVIADIPQPRGRTGILPGMLASVFYRESRAEEPEPEQIVEKPPVSIPQVRYVGKIQMEGTEPTYLFSVGPTGRTLRMQEGGVNGDLKLSRIAPAPNGTVFTFVYREEEFTVSDR